MCTALNMEEGVAKVLHGGAFLMSRTRIHCTVKSTFSETRLVPALNDLLISKSQSGRRQSVPHGMVGSH